MSDLIEREMAIEVVSAMFNFSGDKNVAKVWQQLKELPSAKPEQKTGKWIKIGETGWYGRCSKCGTVTDYNFPYCPYCGKKMAEDKNVRG